VGTQGQSEGPGTELPQKFLIVGIGGSAGGLEALEKFFANVPAKSGMAFVVIQHLAPHHVSILAELLGRTARIPIVEVRDGARVEPDHAYVIAPGTELKIAGGAFVVSDVPRHDAVDVFFASLAEEWGQNAVGIVLSGSGADGTNGLRAIKEHGGLTLAQPPETARHGAMPASAIEAGVVDYVLPVERMPAKLHERALAIRTARPVLLEEQPAARAAGKRIPDKQIAGRIPDICEILLRATGHDFSRYKKGTLLRRIRRRIELLLLPSADEYVERLAKNPEEPALLMNDLLIGVTQFFRDPEAFEFLAQHVIPRILAGKNAAQTVRIWVPGCASGEEAYSIAMLIREQLAGMRSAPRIQIFATDIDQEALAEARRGLYPAEIAEHVSPERLARFFTRDGAHYLVTPELREMCIFSPHSLVRDPPFSGLDLVSCRNVLIYLEAELQRKLIPIFHYALKPAGYLFLGLSEAPPPVQPELFETIDKQHHIYQRIEPIARPAVEFPLAPGAPRVAARPRIERPAPTEHQLICAAFEHLVLQEYAPPAAVVNARGDVLCVAGPTGRYLQPPVGVLTTNILNVAHASLRVDLHAALNEAATRGKSVVRDNVLVKVDDEPRSLRLTVRPLAGIGDEAKLYAVILQEQLEKGISPIEGPEAATELQPAIVAQLESELRTTRAELSATVESFATSNEELQSSNEELQSANEELQSANEELQTSQEELKSVNEELETVNTELQRRVEELAHANNDLKNFFSASDVAILILDEELCVSRFTPAASRLFHLIEADIGRPFGDFAPRFTGNPLADDANQVLRTLVPIQRQAKILDGEAWFLLRLLPYRTQQNVIAGVVIALTDISELKRAEAELRRLATVVKDSDDAITVHDLDGHILAWNRGAVKMYGYSEDEALRMNVAALVPTEGESQIHAVLESVKRGQDIASLEVKRRTKDGRILDVWLTATRLVDEDGRPIAVATTERDMTERNRAERQLREANARLVQAELKDEFLAALSHELRNPLAAITSSLYALDHVEPGSDQARQARAIVGRQVGYLTHIVDDLLDVTRIARGKLRLSRELLDLGQLAHHTVEDHRSLFVARNVELKFLPPPVEVWVNGDRTRLAQAIGNLLQNSLKFTPPGGKTTVSVEADAAHGHAIVRVHDDGSGIAPDVLPRLFEAFVQADTTLDRSRGGLGLGLALVRGLSELHGGSVRGESAGLGKGATFTITLPLGAAPARAVEPERPARGERAQRRVLIIEDSEDLAQSLRLALELDKHVVDIAESGPEGIEKARVFRPDIIFCDIGLPEMDGYAIARALRADPELGRLSLVAMSGYARPEDIAKAKEAGFDSHLAKPPEIEDVLEQVAALPSSNR
jgi:two-component system CheB/CheR fusion protein